MANLKSGTSIGGALALFDGISLINAGAITSTGVISAATGAAGGFRSSTFTAGQNLIWAFGNAPAFGMSYGQGGTDDMRIHFGSYAAPQLQITQAGNLVVTGTVAGTNITTGGNVPGSSGSCTGNAGSATFATHSHQLEAFTATDFTGGDHFVRAIRETGWDTRLYMGYLGDTTCQDSIKVNYANTAGSAPANGGTASAVTITYNNDINSVQQMLWGSGNSVYGTAGIYCVPLTDYLYATNFQLTSDVSLKTNIIPIPIAPINVEYKQFVMKKNPNQIRYGVIAQDLQETNPELVSKGADGLLTISYIDLLIKEVAYLKAKVNDLERRIK